MPNENDTLASRKDALKAYESLFGDAEPGPDDAVAKEQDGKSETGHHGRGSEIAGEKAGADESGPAENPTSDDKTTSPEELKVIVSIRGGRSSIGVQQSSSDPYIESFDVQDVSELAQEVPAVLERAKARWEDAPKHPAYERPATPTDRRTRRNQGSVQASTAEGEAAEQQRQAPRLF